MSLKSALIRRPRYVSNRKGNDNDVSKVVSLIGSSFYDKHKPAAKRHLKLIKSGVYFHQHRFTGKTDDRIFRTMALDKVQHFSQLT